MWNRTEDQIEIHLTLIRHGATLSNKEGRYLGKTDEALSPDGIRTLEKSVTDRIYPIADVLFSGPMKRCLETAQILYPGQTPICIPEWTEMDFGAFEGHNYQELSGRSGISEMDRQRRYPAVSGRREQGRVYPPKCCRIRKNGISHEKDLGEKCCIGAEGSQDTKCIRGGSRRNDHGAAWSFPRWRIF